MINGEEGGRGTLSTRRTTPDRETLYSSRTRTGYESAPSQTLAEPRLSQKSGADIEI